MRHEETGFVVGQDGLSQGSDFMAWDEIDRIFLCSLDWSGSEVLELRVEDGSGRSLREIASTASNRQQEHQRLHEVHRQVLDRVAGRQWEQLLARARRGETLSFMPGVSLDEPGVMLPGGHLLPWVLIGGHSIRDGQVWLTVTDGPAPRQVRLGNVAQTPNLHLLNAYLDWQGQRHGIQSDPPAHHRAEAAPASQQHGWSGTVLVGALGMGLGFGGAWFAFQEFQQLEAGLVPSIRVPAPVAWVANLGPPWYSLAKWCEIGLLVAVGSATLLMVMSTVVKAARSRRP